MIKITQYVFNKQAFPPYTLGCMSRARLCARPRWAILAEANPVVKGFPRSDAVACSYNPGGGGGVNGRHHRLFLAMAQPHRRLTSPSLPWSL